MSISSWSRSRHGLAFTSYFGELTFLVCRAEMDLEAGTLLLDSVNGNDETAEDGNDDSSNDESSNEANANSDGLNCDDVSDSNEGAEK